MGCCTCTIVSVVVALLVLYKVIFKFLHSFYVKRLEQRNILITGCDTGFGNLLTRRLDSLGCRVFAGCLTEAGINDLKKNCSSRLETLIIDVSSPESVRAARDTVKAALPEGQGLWAVVNNAGIGGKMGPPEWLSVNDYKEVGAVNIYGLIDVSITFLPLVKQEKGRIVNMSSPAGKISTSPLMTYSLSKFGVESFSDGLRRAMHPYGVKVITVQPGWTATSMTSRNSTLRPGLERGWASAPPEIKEEYGEEYYNFCMTSLFDSLDRIGSTDTGPVIDVLHHAILGRFPKTKYQTGIDGKYIFRILQMLPVPVFDFALRANVPDMPLPAALTKKTRRD